MGMMGNDPRSYSMLKTPSTMDDILARMGRGNDSLIAHISPREAAILHRFGGSGSINPRTGMLSFDDSDSGGDSGSGNGAGSGGGTGGQGDSDSEGSSGNAGASDSEGPNSTTGMPGPMGYSDWGDVDQGFGTPGVGQDPAMGRYQAALSVALQNFASRTLGAKTAAVALGLVNPALAPIGLALGKYAADRAMNAARNDPFGMYDSRFGPDSMSAQAANGASPGLSGGGDYMASGLMSPANYASTVLSQQSIPNYTYNPPQTTQQAQQGQSQVPGGMMIPVVRQSQPWDAPSRQVAPDGYLDAYTNYAKVPENVPEIEAQRLNSIINKPQFMGYQYLA
jgi:hypothetical protein